MENPVPYVVAAFFCVGVFVSIGWALDFIMSFLERLFDKGGEQ